MAERRRDLEAGAELIDVLVDGEAGRLGYGGLEQRAGGGADVDRVEVAAVLALGAVGEAHALEPELDLILGGVVVDLERAVVDDAFAVGPARLRQLGLE